MKVKVASTWEKYLGSREKELSVDNNISIADLITYCGLPVEDIGLILKNQKLASREDILQDNDKVEFYPFVGGG